MKQTVIKNKSAQEILQRYNQLPENLQFQIYDYTEQMYKKYF